MTIDNLMVNLFWINILSVLIITFGYPIFLLVVSLIVDQKVRKANDNDNYEPTVSLIIAAFNEEMLIRKKIENSLNLEYPKEKLEIIIFSDGSTDSTNKIVKTFVSKGIILHEYSRLGKTEAQNRSIKKANGEIVIFSDANAMYDKKAVKKMVRNFYDDTVACVCGQLIYQKANEMAPNSGESTYWKYEKFLKRYESKISSLIGANGSIYAIRKDDYIPLDENLISDLVEPLVMVRNKKRVVYEEDALSYENATQDVSNEFNRKVRIITRSLNGFFYMKELFNPLKYGIFSIQLIIHKIFRYIIPFFLLTGYILLIFLTHNIEYYVLFLLGTGTLLLAAIDTGSNKKKYELPMIAHLKYYILTNYAIIIALNNFLRGNKYVLWDPER